LAYKNIMVKEMLKEKFCDYLINNNPDLVIRLQEGNSVAKCIEGKINAIMQSAEHLMKW
jgi:hypothetical protein